MIRDDMIDGVVSSLEGHLVAPCKLHLIAAICLASSALPACRIRP